MPFQLLQLPMDLIPRIVSNLTVDSSRNLISAVNGKANVSALVQECESRLSVCKYLDTTFVSGRKLLNAMGQCGVYISGSQSLEFFVPGITSRSSTWDFYANNMMDAGKFMRLCSNIGIKWHSALTVVEECASRGDGSTYIGKESVETLMSTGILESTAQRFGLELRFEMKLGRSGIAEINVSDKIMRVTCVEDTVWNQCYMADIVVYGTVSNDKYTSPVKLLSYNDKPEFFSLRRLFNYPSSCTQSFIAPHLAAHLYGRVTQLKRSCDWKTLIASDRSTPQADKVTERTKYEARGFLYRPLDQMYRVYRKLGSANPECTIVRCCNETDIPEDVLSMYRRSTNLLKWSDCGEPTTSVRDETVFWENKDEGDKQPWLNSDDSDGDLYELVSNMVI